MFCESHGRVYYKNFFGVSKMSNQSRRLLLEAEDIFQDATIFSEFVPFVEDGEAVLQAAADIFIWLEDKQSRQRKNRPSGRPRIEIDENQLSLLSSYQFSCTDIGGMLQVSARTVRRTIVHFGLEEFTEYANLPDAELDGLTTEFVHLYPNGGHRTYGGYLRAKGIKVQRRQIRESLLRVDYNGVRQRFRRVLHRRRCSVPMPNSLWHFDGHHRLIRWRIIVHGCIDGFSRLPLFLKVATDNTSDTVLQCFLEAVEAFGLPSRVRCDKGGENVKVSEFMLNHPQRGPGRGSCITGRSVHNQRIERLWRDVFSGCVSLFYALEDEGLLDVNNDADLFALHYIYMFLEYKNSSTFFEKLVLITE